MTRTCRVLGAAAGATALVLSPITAATASAVPGYESCFPGWVCVYDWPNGLAALTSFDQNCEFHNLGERELGDLTTSAANFTDKQVYLLDWNPATEGWNTLWHMAPGTTGNMPAGTDNRTDAIQVCA